MIQTPPPPRAGGNWAVCANGAQHLQSFHPGPERKGSDLTGDRKRCSVTCSQCSSQDRGEPCQAFTKERRRRTKGDGKSQDLRNPTCVSDT